MHSAEKWDSKPAEPTEPQLAVQKVGKSVDRWEQLTAAQLGGYWVGSMVWSSAGTRVAEMAVQTALYWAESLDD